MAKNFKQGLGGGEKPSDENAKKASELQKGNNAIKNATGNDEESDLDCYYDENETLLDDQEKQS